MSNARRVKVVRKTMFLDPDDGYSSVTDISLRNDDLGSYYIFVATNVYRNVKHFTIYFTTLLKVYTYIGNFKLSFLYFL